MLTEADLIALMEKHGIGKDYFLFWIFYINFKFFASIEGTDATHAEHIETIKERFYVSFENNRFEPAQLGLGLVEGYDSMGYAMSKPNLRAALEEDLKAFVN